MEKKCYRFLYGEMDGCFVHIGEIKDMKTGKQLAFGYIRSIDGHVDQEESEHTLFLCPKKLDVIILGNIDDAVKRVLKKFMEHALVDTLVVPEGLGFAGLSFMSRRTVTLCLSVDQPERLYRFSAAGWKLIAATYERGRVVFAHGLSCTEETDPEGISPYDLGDFLPDGYYKKNKLCVSMEKECARSKCGESGNYENTLSPNCIGTVLLTGEMKGIKLKMFESELEENIQGIRFVGVCGKEASEQEKIEEMAALLKDKRYFIGVGDELSDGFLDKICRNGMYGNPVTLQEEQAFCCCGVVTYEE